MSSSVFKNWAEGFGGQITSRGSTVLKVMRSQCAVGDKVACGSSWFDAKTPLDVSTGQISTKIHPQLNKGQSLSLGVCQVLGWPNVGM